MNEFIIFNQSNTPDIFQYFKLFSASNNQTEIVTNLLNLIEKYNLDKNLFKTLVLNFLINNENIFSLSLERKIDIDDNLVNIFKKDLRIIYDFYLNAQTKINDQELLDLVSNFKSSLSIVNQEIFEIKEELYNNLSNSKNFNDFYQNIYNFYYQYGVGKYGINKAFRYENNSIIPIKHIGNDKLEHLVNCKRQLDLLCENTEAFLNNQPANNVLLYGDSGTGKSSSIKALLNTYYRKRLRIIEIFKHQFADLPEIIQELQERNYYFILFMDDLSFEDFEVEYKYLKAIIEGGLEEKPSNILIYATSNRRHIVREMWSDREGNDINRNDTIQEKISLSLRFGLQILYSKPEKDDYLKIVDSLAKRYNIDMNKDELHRHALMWEVRHGGKTGRTAKQFIMSLQRR